jgi:hypothetical protein
MSRSKSVPKSPRPGRARPVPGRSGIRVDMWHTSGKGSIIKISV